VPDIAPLADEVVEELASHPEVKRLAESAQQSVEDFIRDNPIRARTAAADASSAASFRSKPSEGKGGVEEARAAAQADPMMQTDAQRRDSAVEAGRPGAEPAKSNPLDAVFPPRDKGPVEAAAAQAAAPPGVGAPPPTPPAAEAEGASVADRLKSNKGKLAAGAAAAGGAAYLAGSGPSGTPGANAGTAPSDEATARSKQKQAAETAPAAGSEAAKPPAAEPAKTPQGKAAQKAGTAAAASAEGPRDTTASIQAKLKGDTGQVRADMQPKLDALDALARQYQSEFTEGKKAAQWGQVAERMGHALAQFGAGYQGMKSGLDMVSGLKFDKEDWAKRYDNLLGELKANLTDIRTRVGEVKEEGRERVASLEKGAEIAGQGAREQAQQEFQGKEGALNRTSREKEAALHLQAEQERAKTMAGAKVQAAEIGAKSRMSVQDSKNALTKALGDKKLDKQGEEDLASFSAYTSALANGENVKEADRLKYQKAGVRLYGQKQADAYTKQATDSSGLFSSTAKPELPAGGKTGGQAPAAAAGYHPPAAGKVHMKDPDGRVFEVPESLVDSKVKEKWSLAQ
jgi:hypothetical protein